MIEKYYTYYLYYLDNELYAYTDEKIYAKKFEEFRDMNLIKKIKKKLTREEVNYIADEYQDIILREYPIKVYDKESYKYYDMNLILTTIEYLTIQNIKTSIGDIELFNKCIVNPIKLKPDVFDALVTVGYVSSYLIYNGLDDDDIRSKLPKPDDLSIFIYYYGKTIKK